MSKEVSNRVPMNDVTSNTVKMVAEREFIQEETEILFMGFI